MQHFILLLAIPALFATTWGHGMMLDPIGRASRWREDPTAPANYNDNECFCGGFSVQFNQNDGKCGICGDNYKNPTPRAHELGGEYGQGVIVRTYQKASTIRIGFRLTQNHLGFIFIHLCNMDKSRKETEDCFEHRLKFADGSDKFYVGDRTGEFETTAVLPVDVTCKHCILRWTYRAGNNWNFCGNSFDGALGCGDQEHFMSCADISIL